jgi:hypothetical protein
VVKGQSESRKLTTATWGGIRQNDRDVIMIAQYDRGSSFCADILTLRRLPQYFLAKSMPRRASLTSWKTRSLTTAWRTRPPAETRSALITRAVRRAFPCSGC